MPTFDDFVEAAGRGRFDRVYRYGDVMVACGGRREAGAQNVGNAARTRDDFPCAPHFIPDDYRLTDHYRSALGDGRQAWIDRLRADGIEVAADGLVAERHRGDPDDLLPPGEARSTRGDAGGGRRSEGDQRRRARLSPDPTAHAGPVPAMQLGMPVVHRGIVVAPIFPRRAPEAAYLTLAPALDRGLRAAEVDEGGSVPELIVVNPLDSDVLLYDGEELLGAKQNRILDVTVLVGAGTETRIPVSCVEAGRWSRRSEHFSSARHASHPNLRRRKAEALASRRLARGAAQAAVWDEVAAKADRLGVRSATGASADAFAGKDADLAELRGAFPLQPGQCGAVLALGPERICLDYLSRPQAFAELYPKLLEGYLLDALERLDGSPAETADIEGFLIELGRREWTRGPSVALGEDLSLRGDGLLGSGLGRDGETLQLSGFTATRA